MTLRPSLSAALARDSRIAAAAAQVMPKGNAVDALVAGVLAAAAVSPVVLLGPLQAIVAGPGVGLRGLDGRSRQPGRGVSRPRGFVSRKEIAEAAYVAAPGLPSALAALLASFGSMTLRRVARPGIELAPTERRAVLSRFADEGPSSLGAGETGEELLAAAGRLAGGVLTRADLNEAVPTIRACHKEGKSPRSSARPPWAAEAGSCTLRTDVLVVADSKGLVAAACFASSEAEVAVAIPALGLVAPRMADPVMRGVRRAGPGSLLAAPVPIAVAARGESEGFDLALGVEGPNAEVVLERALGAVLATGLLPEAVADGGAALFVATRARKVAGSALLRLSI